MKNTVVGLITPHFLKVVDLANQAETGVNVDWHLRNEVASTVEDLGHQYNARELLSAFVDGLETAARDARPGRKRYADLLRTAASMAAVEIKRFD